MSTGNDILAGMAFEMADKINVDAARKIMELENAESAAAAAAACSTTVAKPTEEGEQYNLF